MTTAAQLVPEKSIRKRIGQTKLVPSNIKSAPPIPIVANGDGHSWDVQKWLIGRKLARMMKRRLLAAKKATNTARAVTRRRSNNAAAIRESARKAGKAHAPKTATPKSYATR